jgi:hypothetical protein
MIASLLQVPLALALLLMQAVLAYRLLFFGRYYYYI